MEITSGALKHGIRAEAIRAVLVQPLRLVPQGDRILYIGVAPNRDLLEVVVEKPGPAVPVERVVHAMRLRPKNYLHLQPH